MTTPSCARHVRVIDAPTSSPSIGRGGGSLNDIDAPAAPVHDQLTRLEHAVWRALENVRFRTASELDTRLRRAHHISLAEYSVLEALSADGDRMGMRMSDIAAATMARAAALTSRVDKLQRQGLIERFVDPDDRRGLLVGMTADGRRRLEQAQVVLAFVIRDRFIGRLTPHQLRRMRAILDEVAES